MSKQKKDYTPNDRRSIVKNPTSREYELDRLNTERQLSETGGEVKEQAETKQQSAKKV